jgi:hypothetical protein
MSRSADSKRANDRLCGSYLIILVLWFFKQAYRKGSSDIIYLSRGENRELQKTS